MKYSAFSALADIDQFADLGFDGVELDMREIRALSEEDFADLLKKLKELKLEVCAGSWIIDNTIHIFDCSFDKAGWLMQFRSDAARLKAMECPTVVFGAGPIRRVGNDDLSQVRKETINSFIIESAKVFKTEDIGMALECVCCDYSDYILSLSEADEICRLDGAENLYLLTDLRHLTRRGDDPDEIVRLGEHLIHAHIDNPIKLHRLAPMPDDGYSYEFFIRRLLNSSVRWLSWECHDQKNWMEAGPQSLRYIKGIVTRLKNEKGE